MRCIRKTTTFKAFIGAVLLYGTSFTNAQSPMGTAFTYQGQLKHAGIQVDGDVDLLFGLFDAAEAGNQIGDDVLVNNVTVIHGLFTVSFDFGAAAFNGDALWLDVAVRSPHDPTDTEPFTALNPRQPLTAAPYSLQTRGIHVSENGRVGIGTSTPTQLLDLRHASDAGISVFGDGDLDNSHLTLGQDSAHYMKLEYNGSRDTLDVIASNDGGFIGFPIVSIDRATGDVGIGTSAPQASLHVRAGADATPTGGGYAIFGNTSATNIIIDNNEIMARDNGTVSTLYINHNGGTTSFGGPIDIGYQIVTAGDHTSVSVSCPSGKRVIGGGCYDSGPDEDPMYRSYPLSNGTGWHCAIDDGTVGAGFVTAYAICANVR
jgi:hypothetical protein